MEYTVKKEEDSYYIEIEGDMDLYSIFSLREELLRQIAEKPVDLTLNMAEVSYIDSAGIGLLIELKRTLEEVGKVFHIQGLIEEIIKLFKTIQLDKVFEINLIS